MINWPCGFGTMARQHSMTECVAEQSHSPHGRQVKKGGETRAFQGHAPSDLETSHCAPKGFTISYSTALGAKSLTPGLWVLPSKGSQLDKQRKNKRKWSGDRKKKQE